jgi:phosphate-selective porin OprO/OprP
MKNLFATVIVLFGLISIIKAQNESDEATLNSPDKRAIILNDDSTAWLNFRFRMQNRVGYFSTLDDTETPGYDLRVRRLRLRIDGYFTQYKLSYYIQLSFSRSDQDFSNDFAPNIVRDAIVYYHFNENWYVGFGQSKLPGNRQRVISSGNIQMPDRSVANNTFTIDRDMGIFLYGKENLFLNVIGKYKAAITSGEGRNANFTNDGLAYTNRLEILPFGYFENTGDYSEGDLEFEEKPKLSLGATYSYNHKTTRTGGQIGSNLPYYLNMRTFIVDGIFKYRGFSLLGEYFYRTISGYQVPDQDVYANVPQGKAYMLQGSYMLNPKNEIIARYSNVETDKNIFNNQLLHQTYAIGYARYINKHRVKFQTYLGLDNRSEIPNIHALNNRWVILTQIEFGI